MSVVRFELKDVHIKLLRNMEWGVGELDTIIGNFYGDSILDEMGLIVFGKPENDFDPLSDIRVDYSNEQIEYLNTLKIELPTALDIVMQTGDFKCGWYKRKYHLKTWKLDVSKN